MGDPVINDLRWLATSPSLVHGEALGHSTVGPLPCAAPSAEELLPLREVRASKRLRLGLYFEDLVEIQLRHTAGVTDLRRGIPVRENRRTLGELDFLFRNATGEWEHWEVAVKFYLHHPDQDGDPDRCFLGPRTIDRFDRKVSRMREHQLPLSSRETARQTLDLEGPLVRRALVRGRLFYPLQIDWRRCEVGSLPAPGHLRGWWAARRELSELPTAEGYLVVGKCDWLTCPPPSTGAPPRSLQSLLRELPDPLPHPVQVIGVDGEGQELHRGFLVPDTWPGSPQAPSRP